MKRKAAGVLKWEVISVVIEKLLTYTEEDVKINVSGR